MTAVLIIFGSALLFFGGDWLVQGAGTIAQRLGLSRLAIGLTVVAFGTSTPELAVSLYSSWKAMPDVAVGNIVGSNIINILLVLGLAAVISPITVSKSLFRFDLPFLMIVSLLSYALAKDGSVSSQEGLLLFLCLLGYLWYCFHLGKKQGAQAAVVDCDGVDEILGEKKSNGYLATAKLVLGITFLVVGSRLFIDGAIQVAESFQVSELVIGVTMVALGTSLPEVATTVAASIRGEKDIALGNIVGSNIFNLLAVLGLSASFSPVEIAVAPDAIKFEFPVMLAITGLCFPVFYWKFRIGRVRGLFFLCLYAAYVAWLFNR